MDKTLCEIRQVIATLMCKYVARENVRNIIFMKKCAKCCKPIDANGKNPSMGLVMMEVSINVSPYFAFSVVFSARWKKKKKNLVTA